MKSRLRAKGYWGLATDVRNKIKPIDSPIKTEMKEYIERKKQLEAVKCPIDFDRIRKKLQDT